MPLALLELIQIELPIISKILNFELFLGQFGGVFLELKFYFNKILNLLDLTTSPRSAHYFDFNYVYFR